MATIAQEFIEQGIEQGIKQVARRLLKLHDLVTVSELTNLTIDEVKALQDDEQRDES